MSHQAVVGTPGQPAELQRRMLIALGALALLLGLVFAWRIPRGLPYDEPSHWSNVVFYGRHLALPVMGRPGVDYEGAQAPLSYVLAALLAGLVRMLTGSDLAAFRAVRILGGLELLAAGAFLFGIVRRLLGPREFVATLAAVGCFALAPVHLAIGWSVGNDALFLTAGFGVSYLALRLDEACEGRMGLRAGLLLGVAAGGALLVKLTVAPLLAALVIWLLARPARRRSVAAAGGVIVGASVVCGWWFIRNEVLYGQATQPSKYTGQGPDFPPLGLHGVSTAKHIAAELVTFWWTPNEYYRDTIALPPVVKGILALGTVAALLGGLWWVRLHVLRGGAAPQTLALRSAWTLVSLTALISLAFYTVTLVWINNVSARFAYLDLPLWFGLLGGACALLARRVRTVVLWTVVAGLLVAFDLWVLHAVAGVDAGIWKIHL